MSGFVTIEDLKVHYPIRSGFFNRVTDHVYAVDGVSLEIEEGKTYGFGKLDIMNGSTYGFLRNTSVGPDVYVSISQIKRFYLRNEDIVFGELRIPIGTEKNYGILKVLLVNGDLPEKSLERPFFDDLIPSYPDEKLNLGSGEVSSRIIDLISPIGKGQRGLIVAPPKAGKTVLLSTLANDIIKYNGKLLKKEELEYYLLNKPLRISLYK